MELSADPSSAPPQPAAAAAAATPVGRPVLPSVPASELDAGIQALVLAAQLSGTELWQQVQAMPVLFARGGLFYRLAERDVGLVDGKHISLEALPGKVRRGGRYLRLRLRPLLSTVAWILMLLVMLGVLSLWDFGVCKAAHDSLLFSIHR